MFSPICTLTYATISRRHKLIIMWALASETSLGVNTRTVKAGLWTFALVYISTIASCSIRFISLVAFTSEHSEDIFTTTV